MAALGSRPPPSIGRGKFRKEKRVKYEVDFDIAPERGEVVVFDGRPFTAMGYEAYVRKDGRSSSLIIWETDCSVCGKRFEVKTGFQSKTISKRCEEHRRMGSPATDGAKARMRAWRFKR